jgi:hypothetical protein
VAKAREVQHRAASARVELDLRALPATLQAKAQQAPTIALTKALETAGLAEEAYGDLSARGKKLIERISQQAATKELLNQSKLTISRGKAVVTTVRRGSKDTQTAARAAVTTARRETAEVAEETQKTVAAGTAGTAGTRRAAKRTTTTAKKRATRAKSTAKATATSAGKTAAAAGKATQAAAEKVGS